MLRKSTRTVAPGEHVFYIGDPSMALYIVRNGAIKIYCTTEGGEEQVPGFYLPEDFFGFDGPENEAHQSSAMVLEFGSIYIFPFASGVYFKYVGQDIGNYLGLAMESISRVMTHFQQSRLIEVHRREITISNLEKLQHMTGTKQ